MDFLPDSPVPPQLSAEGEKLMAEISAARRPPPPTPFGSMIHSGRPRTRLVHTLNIKSLRLNDLEVATPSSLISCETQDEQRQPAANKSTVDTDASTALACYKMPSVTDNDNRSSNGARITAGVVSDPRKNTQSSSTSSCGDHRVVRAVQFEANGLQEGKSWAAGSILSQPQQPPTLIVNGHKYTVLKEVGRGASSRVLSVYNENVDLFAIKCVDLSNADPTISQVYLNEIILLERLQHSRRVIKFYEHEYNQKEGMLYVVMERGDVDLATLIHRESKEGGGMAPEIVVCHWAEMLRAVRDIHGAGVIHSDLKPANFLLVAGKLKLIDFGIASVIPKDVTSIIKDVKCGTPSYMSPEALMDVQHQLGDDEAETNEGGVHVKIGVKSDVWSLGCILYHMVYGRTPFQHMRSDLRLLAIVDPSFKIEFPALNDTLLLDVLKKCIVRDVKRRASVDDLLAHPYIPRSYKPTGSSKSASENQMKM